MGEELGPLTYGQPQQEIFLGREFAQHRDYSESTALAIDTEVRRLVTENYERAKKLIIENKNALIAIAEALIERETLDAGDLDRILGEQGITPGVAPAPTPA